MIGDSAAIIISSIISGLVALFVAGVQHSKTAALFNYRLDQVEKKMDIHNQVQNRTSILERDVKTICIRLDELKEEIKELYK